MMLSNYLPIYLVLFVLILVHILEILKCTKTLSYIEWPITSFNLIAIGYYFFDHSLLYPLIGFLGLLWQMATRGSLPQSLRLQFSSLIVLIIWATSSQFSIEILIALITIFIMIVKLAYVIEMKRGYYKTAYLFVMTCLLEATFYLLPPSLKSTAATLLILALFVVAFADEFLLETERSTPPQVTIFIQVLTLFFMVQKSDYFFINHTMLFLVMSLGLTLKGLYASYKQRHQNFVLMIGPLLLMLGVLGAYIKTDELHELLMISLLAIILYLSSSSIQEKVFYHLTKVTALFVLGGLPFTPHFYYKLELMKRWFVSHFFIALALIFLQTLLAIIWSAALARSYENWKREVNNKPIGQYVFTSITFAFLVAALLFGIEGRATL